MLNSDQSSINLGCSCWTILASFGQSVKLFHWSDCSVLLVCFRCWGALFSNFDDFIRRITGCACCSSRSSSSYIVWFNSSSWTSSKSSSIWPESGLKRRSPGLKKHMLIRSTIVRIRTRRDHFWTSSVLVEQLHQKIHVQKYEEMEWSAGPIGSRANILKICASWTKLKQLNRNFITKLIYFKCIDINVIIPNVLSSDIYFTIIWVYQNY